jgi:hypothetical protein
MLSIVNGAMSWVPLLESVSSVCHVGGFADMTAYAKTAATAMIIITVARAPCYSFLFIESSS